MKINWAERLMVNSPIRVLVQRLLVRWFKQKTLMEPGATILEIGCGRGAGAAMLLKEFAPATLHAQDLDLVMIRQARAYLPANQNAIFLYVGDAEHLPYADAALDAVFGFGVLHHVPDWRGGLAEIARVLKPGGRYFLEEFYPALYQNSVARRLFLHPEDRFQRADLHQALRATGFEVQTILEHPLVGILGVAVKEG
ncbi:MAG: class I SAM-dependent methyltransferase [Desulfobaccales bacterium]